jgi:hypothetical protein
MASSRVTLRFWLHFSNHKNCNQRSAPLHLNIEVTPKSTMHADATLRSFQVGRLHSSDMKRAVRSGLSTLTGKSSSRNVEAFQNTVHDVPRAVPTLVWCNTGQYLADTDQDYCICRLYSASRSILLADQTGTESAEQKEEGRAGLAPALITRTTKRPIVESMAFSKPFSPLSKKVRVLLAAPRRRHAPTAGAGYPCALVTMLQESTTFRRLTYKWPSRFGEPQAPHRHVSHVITGQPAGIS